MPTLMASYKKHSHEVDYDRRPKGPCGKVMFRKKDAATQRNLLMRRGNEEFLRIYACPQCNAWHLTKTRVW